jgi:hypothetical protein
MAGYRLPGTHSTLEDRDTLIDEGTQARAPMPHPGPLSVSEHPLDDMARELLAMRRRAPMPAMEFAPSGAQRLAAQIAPASQPTVRAAREDATAQQQAPWMAFAIEQAKHHKGSKETEIEKTINYHTETGATFLKSLAGSDNAWCAQAHCTSWRLPPSRRPALRPSGTRRWPPSCFAAASTSTRARASSAPRP